ncbi:MAG: hypothetical protein R3286_15870 [Gammaproteobacteria bacterium]|nr:hypothetical protein [Gammaproteobacteria bacterium]
MKRTLAVALALVAVALLAACAAQAPRPAGPQPAEIVPRADNLGMNLTIDRIDERIVNVPEAHILEIEPGPRRVGVKIEYNPVSGSALIFGIGAFGAVAGALGAREGHMEVEFTAEPGRRYHLNGDVEDGAFKIWVVDDETKDIVSF